MVKIPSYVPENKITFRGSDYTKDDVLNRIKFMKVAQFAQLTVEDRRFSGKSVTEIINALGAQVDNLVILSLAGNQLRRDTPSKIQSILANNSKLRYVNFSHNKIAREGLDPVLNMVQLRIGNPIEYLDLSHNRLRSGSAQILADRVEDLRGVKKLNLCNNRFTTKDIELLKTVCAQAECEILLDYSLQSHCNVSIDEWKRRDRDFENVKIQYAMLFSNAHDTKKSSERQTENRRPIKVMPIGKRATKTRLDRKSSTKQPRNANRAKPIKKSRAKQVNHPSDSSTKDKLDQDKATGGSHSKKSVCAPNSHDKSSTKGVERSKKHTRPLPSEPKGPNSLQSEPISEDELIEIEFSKNECKRNEKYDLFGKSHSQQELIRRNFWTDFVALTDAKGRNGLHRAIISDNIRAVILVCQHPKAILDACRQTDHSGLTPIEYAQRKEIKEIFTLFTEAVVDAPKVLSKKSGVFVCSDRKFYVDDVDQSDLHEVVIEGDIDKIYG